MDTTFRLQQLPECTPFPGNNDEDLILSLWSAIARQSASRLYSAFLIDLSTTRIFAELILSSSSFNRGRP
jgi:hypothetical protein